ncbi:unnamed protein product [Vitrella brassicaformis CCMP3155]|uniref:Uncharacterized protein n=1 Tax=Vitrella brassicaformis (strain CCMP3155) TaxID=1169540 RepID=A0A0G4EMV6_VITBC|nr:unnamed protein product [Vitrella brassicaformis CCMP3155]|mmetsp:Transcript_13188/g.31471  ORF Transcript_13188/g.31471 Transcript_13188/m.31471 type:complete len:530 (-) Transcript_13188:281-1870(-)|eukprot:CEL98501.1 unnamed protein product [Vitrella brassicaformis CCMP3155]
MPISGALLVLALAQGTLKSALAATAAVGEVYFPFYEAATHLPSVSDELLGDLLGHEVGLAPRHEAATALLTDLYTTKAASNIFQKPRVSAVVFLESFPEKPAFKSDYFSLDPKDKESTVLESSCQTSLCVTTSVLTRSPSGSHGVVAPSWVDEHGHQVTAFLEVAESRPLATTITEELLSSTSTSDGPLTVCVSGDPQFLELGSCNQFQHLNSPAVKNANKQAAETMRSALSGLEENPSVPPAPLSQVLQLDAVQGLIGDLGAVEVMQSTPGEAPDVLKMSFLDLEGTLDANHHCTRVMMGETAALSSLARSRVVAEAEGRPIVMMLAPTLGTKCAADRYGKGSMEHQLASALTMHAVDQVLTSAKKQSDGHMWGAVLNLKPPVHGQESQIPHRVQDTWRTSSTNISAPIHESPTALIHLLQTSVAHTKRSLQDASQPAGTTGTAKPTVAQPAAPQAGAAKPSATPRAAQPTTNKGQGEAVHTTQFQITLWVSVTLVLGALGAVYTMYSMTNVRDPMLYAKVQTDSSRR